MGYSEARDSMRDYRSSVEHTWTGFGLETSPLLLMPVGLARSSGLHRVTDLRDLPSWQSTQGQGLSGTRQQSNTTPGSISRREGTGTVQ